MFRVEHKVTGDVVTVYAVMSNLALIYTGTWEWVTLNDYLPVEMETE